MTGRPSDPHDTFAPLTTDERHRIGALLETVSSQTLLHSLARLNEGNADASLIIAELIGRLPLEERPRPA